MKKLVAIICAVAMLMSFACTASADEWDFLSQEYKSYDATVEFYVQLNKPLEIAGLLNEDAGFDVKYFVEELCKAKYTANMQAEISEDKLAAKMYMGINSNVPINLSEDLKFGTDVTMHMWIEYNFTDVENAKYMMIIKNPLNGEYMYLDMLDEAVMGVDAEMLKSMMVTTYQSLDMNAGIKEITELVKNVYSGNATIAKTNDGYTQVSFTNDGLVNMAFELVLGMLDTEYMKNAMASSGADMSVLSINDTDVEQAKIIAKGLGLFADTDAYTMKFKTNSKGQMTEAEEKLHIQFNVYELCAAMGETDVYPLTKENSDVDITFVTKAVYDKIDEQNVVTIPALTEENSVSLADMLGVGDVYADDYYYDEDYYVEYEAYQPEKFWDYATGKMERGGMYVDIEEFFESAQWDADALTGTVALDGNAVAITFTSNNFGTVDVVGSLREDNYVLSGTQLWCRRPFIAVDEYNWETYAADKKVYVHIDVLHYILGAQVESMTAYLIDEDGTTLTEPEYYFDVVRPNPGYVPADDYSLEVPDILFFDEEAAAIGIIGGADGPTEVFVME